MSMPLWGFVMAVMCAVSWAVSPLATDHGTEIGSCTSNEINPVRSWAFLLTALVFVLFAEHGHIPPVTDIKIQLMIGLGVVLNYILGDVFYYMAIRMLGVNIAIPIANAYPVFLVFLAAAILDEKISLVQFAAIFTVVVGIGLLKVGGQKGAEVKTEKRWAAGLLLTILAGLSWSLCSIVTKLVLQKTAIGAAALSFYRACWLLPLAYAVHAIMRCFCPEKTVPLSSVPLKARIYYWISGVIGLSIGYTMYAYCVKTLPVATVTPITATSPLIAALCAHFVMKKKLTAIQWAGVGMIIAGSVLVSI